MLALVKAKDNLEERNKEVLSTFYPHPQALFQCSSHFSMCNWEWGLGMRLFSLFILYHIHALISIVVDIILHSLVVMHTRDCRSLQNFVAVSRRYCRALLMLKAGCKGNNGKNWLLSPGTSSQNEG